jgi:hypothetical protein
MKKARIFIFLFILLLIFFVWVWQKNIFSKEILKMEILGPEEIILGQEVEYIVKYKNNGNFRLEEPELIFEPPENSLKDGKIFERQILGKEQLGEAIYPGEEKIVSFKFQVLGKEGDKKIAHAILSYRPKNLRAKYQSLTTFTTIIKSVPLSFDFDLPSKIESGKEIKFRLNYFSNLDFPLLSLRVTIEYPLGFEFIESQPPSLEKTEWKLPPLNKSEGGRIEISGRINGEIGEQKIIKAKIGIWQENNFIVLKEISKGIEIIKPTLWVFQQINGNPKYIPNPGDLLHYEIFFKNIGKETLSSLSLITTLMGDVFDLQTIKAPEGEFTPGDNSIVWDWRKLSTLQFLEPGQEGKVEFWVNLKKDWEIPSLEGNIKIKNRVFLGQLTEEFEYKVNSKLEIIQKGFFQDEVFGNSGPIPPRVGETTTYTIIWQVKNYYNNVKNVKVKAILPQNVKLTGKIFPEKEIEKFTFDSQSREIVWNVGDLRVASGVLNPPLNIAFQVALTPTFEQRGKLVEIIKEVKLTAEDEWTGATIEIATSPLDTSLPDDPTISREKGIVQ